jgi:hypothetical protein
VRPFVHLEPRAAIATLGYVTEVRNPDGGYSTDPAWQMRVAAIRNTARTPISPEGAARFGPQRQLGWRPLESAFHEIVAVSSTLGVVRTAASRG